MTKKIPRNSFWPNGIDEILDDTDNQKTYAFFYKLGYKNIKIQEEGLTLSTNWPKGDELKYPFVYDYRENEDGTVVKKLVGFCDTKSIEVDKATPICLPYKHIEADFSKIVKGDLAIYAPNLDSSSKVIWKDETKPEELTNGTTALPNNDVDNTVFDYQYKGCTTASEVETANSNYYNVTDGVWTEPLFDLTDMNLGTSFNVKGMFSKTSGRNTITSFKADLPNVTRAKGAFAETGESAPTADTPSTAKLISFEGNLSKLKNGQSMFLNCHNLSTFNSDLSSLTNGTFMFENCYNLSTFNCGNLSSLTNGHHMFDECKTLTTFSYNLKNMRNGFCMFSGCKELVSFNSDLSSLECGTGMFNGCKLDTASVQKIANTIKNVKEGVKDKILIDDSEVTTKSFGIGIGNEKPNTKEEEAFNMMVSKGWKVYVNGSTVAWVSTDGTNNLDETGEERITPIPFYAKPIPATEETAEYIDENGNFFNILGAQFIYGDDLSTYGMFVSLEDAAANMRLTPYSKNQTNI